VESPLTLEAWGARQREASKSLTDEVDGALGLRWCGSPELRELWDMSSMSSTGTYAGIDNDKCTKCISLALACALAASHCRPIAQNAQFNAGGRNDVAPSVLPVFSELVRCVHQSLRDTAATRFYALFIKYSSTTKALTFKDQLKGVVADQTTVDALVSKRTRIMEAHEKLIHFFKANPKRLSEIEQNLQRLRGSARALELFVLKTELLGHLQDTNDPDILLLGALSSLLTAKKTGYTVNVGLNMEHLREGDSPVAIVCRSKKGGAVVYARARNPYTLLVHPNGDRWFSEPDAEVGWFRIECEPGVLAALDAPLDRARKPKGVTFEARAIGDLGFVEEVDTENAPAEEAKSEFITQTASGTQEKQESRHRLVRTMEGDRGRDVVLMLVFSVGKPKQEDIVGDVSFAEMIGEQYKKELHRLFSSN